MFSPLHYFSNSRYHQPVILFTRYDKTDSEDWYIHNLSLICTVLLQKTMFSDAQWA